MGPTLSRRCGMQVLSDRRLITVIVVVVLCAAVLPTGAEAKRLNIMTATTDMAALTQEVGGDKVNVEALAKGYQDPHFVEAKPSFLLKLRQADLLIVVGLRSEERRVGKVWRRRWGAWDE